MRRHFTLASGRDRLVATLDEGAATSGLLIVTGGNELRSGAWAGQAGFAARIADRGYPVLRFDRRGCGDSEGANGSFRDSAPDIAAALAAFRAECPHLTRVVAMGNCDAASALMLAGGGACDALILSNPWTFDSDATDEAPPEAVRSHYRRRLADPAAIKRLLTGKVALGGLVRSLVAATRPAPPPTSLIEDMLAGIARFAGEAVVLIAGRDRTGQAFLAHRGRCPLPIHTFPGATHSYVEPEAQDWLLTRTLEMLERKPA